MAIRQPARRPAAIEPGGGQQRTPAAPAPVRPAPAAPVRPAVDPNAIRPGHVMTNTERAQYEALRRRDPAAAQAYKAGIVGVSSMIGSTPQNLIDNSNQIGGMGQDIVKQNLETGDWGNFDPESNLTPRNGYQPFKADLQPRTGTGDLVADRARIEDEVFNRLTRGADTQFARTAQEHAQELHDKGIPMGSKRYNEEMDRFEKSKNNFYLDARSNAAQLGGQEYERSFGIGEQGRANDYNQQMGSYQTNFNNIENQRQNQYNEQSGIRNQRLGEMGQFLGYGQQPIDNYNQQQQLENQRRQTQAAIDQLKKNRGGRGPGDGRVHGYGGRGPDSGQSSNPDYYGAFD